LALVGCSEITAPTSEASTRLASTTPAYAVLVNEKTLVTDVPLLNACNGEMVVVSGKKHLVIKSTKNGYSVSEDSHFSGVGAVTGARYKGSQKYTHKEATNKKDKFSFSKSSSVHLVGQGKDVPEMLYEYSTKLTIDDSNFISHEDSGATLYCNKELVPPTPVPTP